MLKLAAKQFLTSIGDHFFIANPDNLEWNEVNCLNLAVRRSPKWFWQKDIYIYDHFGLNDILESPLPNDLSHYLTPPEIITPKYSLTSKHDIKGEIGGKIASLACLDLSADDTFTFNIDFEGVEKQSIDFAEVAQLLSTVKANLNCPYIRNLAMDKHNFLCLVTQYIYLTKATDIKILVNRKFDEKLSDAPKIITNQGDLQSQINKTISFEAGTRLAFDFSQIIISPDGTMEILDRSEVNLGQSSIPFYVEPPKRPEYGTSPEKTTIKPKPLIEHDEASSQKTKDNLDITKHLLALAIDDKATLKNVELFILKYQQCLQKKEETIDIVQFNLKSNVNQDLVDLFKRMGIDLENSPSPVEISTLNPDMAGKILLKIQSIYHLEVQYLKNLQDVLVNCDYQTVANLVSYLANLEKMKEPDNEVYEGLQHDPRTKLLLLTIGVLKDKLQLNQYFHPVLILLQ